MTTDKLQKQAEKHATKISKHYVNGVLTDVHDVIDYDKRDSEVQALVDALKFIRENARSAIVLSTQEGTKAEAFDFVVSTLEEKANQALSADSAKVTT